MVLLVYRHHLVDPRAPETDAELIVAKNRNGAAPVTAYVDWEGQFTRFVDTGRSGPSALGNGPGAIAQALREHPGHAYDGPNPFGF